MRHLVSALIVIAVSLAGIGCNQRPGTDAEFRLDWILENVYTATGREPQSLEFIPNDEQASKQPRIAVRVDAFGPSGSGTGHGPGGAGAVYSYYFGRLHFDDGTRLDVTKMSLEGWPGQPPAVVIGTPIRTSK
ncbi:MAG: hypothetical protein ABIV13_07415 [Fimbriimonadales bacterium]